MMDREGGVFDLDVVVGIVTHRRPASLRVLLHALAVQEYPGRDMPRVGVVVVDNSPAFEARDVVERMRIEGVSLLEYVPLGSVNISRGRNAVLEWACARAPLVALIDDDERPDTEWLHHLLAGQDRTSADVVLGPVLGEYPDDAPIWLRASDFHSVGSSAPAGWVDEGHTGNALIRSDMVLRLGLSFDEALGRSGGEDQLFFRQAMARGAQLFFEPAAVAHEPVPRERLSVRYLLRREFRKGGTLGLLDRSRPGWPAGHPGLRVVRALWWALTGMVVLVRGILARDRRVRVTGSMRFARAAGMIHGLVAPAYELYAASAATQPSRPSMAIVTAEGPEYQRAGHSQYLRGFVSHYVGAGYDVTVVVPGPRTGFLVRRVSGGLDYQAPALRTLAGWQVVTAPAAIAGQVAWAVFRRSPRVLQRMVDRARTARRSGSQVDHVLGAWLSTAQSRWVGRAIERLRPDVVLFNTVFMVPEPLTLPDSVELSAVICHDVVHERAASFRAAGSRVAPADFTAAHEAERLAAVDALIAIQWDDAAALQGLVPRARVLVSPVVVDVDGSPRGDAVPGRCLFVGSGSLHNVQALRWFLQECWPAVRRAWPASELHVVGTVCSRMERVPGGVILRGEVPELATEYRRAQVAIAPLLAGSGLKVKVVESLCHGVATVVTSVGAQGLGAVLPRPYLLADTAAEFSASVVDLLADRALRERTEAAAMSAAPLFSSGQAYRDLDDCLTAARRLPAWSTSPEGSSCVPVG